jgi:hypothetical protein
MRGPCEVCLEHNRVRPLRDVRCYESIYGLIYLDVCGPHSSALTVLPEYQAREAKPINVHTRIHVDEQGRASAHEVE